MSEKLELRLSEWNSIVCDKTQCVRLSHDGEIALLSSKSKNLAEYLKLHPEMAHESMVPSGFIQRLVRRYERYLGGTQMLSTQNGTAKKAQWDQEVFDAILPGEVHVVENPTGATRVPTWRELSLFVCKNGTCTLDGEVMAPQYEYKETGKRVRLISYGWVDIAGKEEKRHSLKIEVTEKQWHLMWDHIVCQFTKPWGNDLSTRPPTPDQIEFIALHKAYSEIASIPAYNSDWQWPGGQQIAIILKQLEARVRAIHKRVPKWNCDSPGFIRNQLNLGGEYRYHPKILDDMPLQEFLTKEEAASLVCEARIKEGRTTFGVNYDPAVRAELEKRGVKLPAEGANCIFVGDGDTNVEANGDCEDCESCEDSDEDRDSE